MLLLSQLQKMSHSDQQSTVNLSLTDELITLSTAHSSPNCSERGRYITHANQRDNTDYENCRYDYCEWMFVSVSITIIEGRMFVFFSRVRSAGECLTAEFNGYWSIDHVCRFHEMAKCFLIFRCHWSLFILLINLWYN